ncbi:MAG: hypothetical protein K2H85_03265, partial [Allobaculum sp.]|nr:hypothetical protein [Allobaculum sp.]
EASQILSDNVMLLHELAKYLYEKETITGEEFMEIVHKYQEEQNKPQALTVSLDKAQSDSSAPSTSSTQDATDSSSSTSNTSNLEQNSDSQA